MPNSIEEKVSKSGSFPSTSLPFQLLAERLIFSGLLLRSPLGNMGLAIKLVINAKNGGSKRKELCYNEEHICRDVVVCAYEKRGKSQGHGGDETRRGDGFFYGSVRVHQR